MPGHLIHIGFPKSGSTALAAWFASHPQLDFAPNGIGGYYHAFDIASAAADPPADAPLWQVTSAESFSVPRIRDAPTMSGPGGPRRAISLSESRIRVRDTLLRMCPGATILVVTRGFRTALVSSYSQYVRMGGRLSPRDLVLANASDPPETQLDYDGVVQLYGEAFGADRVIALPYELLRDDPRAFVGALEDRLGLAPGSPPVPSRNVALARESLYWYRRLSIGVGYVCRRVGGRAGEALYAAYVTQIAHDRLGGLARALDRLRPSPQEGDVAVPDELLERFRGRAAMLGERPFYDRYAADYLNVPRAIAART
jgi:hypothetical protein